MLLILLACFAPKPLSDDEEILVEDGPGLDTADSGAGTGFDSGTADTRDTAPGDSGAAAGTAEHSRARVEAWMPVSVPVDSAIGVAGGVLRAERTTGGVSCLHTGLVLPCGSLTSSRLEVDGDTLTVPYAVGPDGGGSLCAWTLAYTLSGVGTNAGSIAVTLLMDGGPAPESLPTATFDALPAEGAR